MKKKTTTQPRGANSNHHAETWPWLDTAGDNQPRGMVMHHGHLQEMLNVAVGGQRGFGDTQGGWQRGEGQGWLTPTALRLSLFSGGNHRDKIRSRLNFIYNLN